MKKVLMMIGALQVEFESRQEVSKELFAIENAVMNKNPMSAALYFGRFKARIVNESDMSEWVEELICKIEEYLIGEKSYDAEKTDVEAIKTEKVEPEAIKLDSLSLSVRAVNCLTRAGIYTVGQLLKLKEDDLCGIRNLGMKCIEELKEKMEELQLQWDL